MTKTPLKCPHNFVSTAYLKEKLSTEDKINAFALSAGTIEFYLWENGYDLTVFSNQYFVWEFWKCLQNSPHTLLSNIKYFHKNLKVHEIGFYRDKWYTKFDNPYHRAAIFYLLNRYSEAGHFSHSEVTKHNFSPLNLQTLEHFAPVVKTIEMIYDNQKDFTNSFPHLEPSSVLLISAGEYKNTFLKSKNVRSIETYYFNHEKIREYLLSERQKVILVYKYNDHADKFFNKKTYINKFGTVTVNRELAEDLIVSNF
jgi:hypothetical protein